ncbi:MAG: DNA repair protein RecO [Coriobacteriales bacterium]|nr:DNA repair protein RecO [Coriobacteriales bacterium]
MSNQGDYKVRGVVLRRTKLGEQDLILTLLTDGAHQVRAVAKGARKPSSKLAGIANLGNEAEFLLHKGKSLDIITESTLLVSRSKVALEYERAAMTEAVLDIAYALTAEGECHELLLPLTTTVLDSIGTARLTLLPLIAAAYILKSSALQGYKPSFDVCVRCGANVELREDTSQGFSFLDGGVVCEDCCTSLDTLEPAPRLMWCKALLGMKFDAICALEQSPDEQDRGIDILTFARTWLTHYPGVNPKALTYLLEEGLF